VADGKKWTTLIDHIARNELKYSAKVAKFVNKVGELVNELDKVLKESTL
jgi:nitrate/nitrite-specific signal transduction histidine kinase